MSLGTAPAKPLGLPALPKPLGMVTSSASQRHQCITTWSFLVAHPRSPQKSNRPEENGACRHTAAGQRRFWRAALVNSENSGITGNSCVKTVNINSSMLYSFSEKLDSFPANLVQGGTPARGLTSVLFLMQTTLSLTLIFFHCEWGLQSFCYV